MAGFLRKKNKIDEKKNKQPPETILQQQSSTSLNPPPLYARFATSTSTLTSSDAASSSTSKPIVSGPMSLASSRKSSSGQGGSERGGGGLNPYGRTVVNGNSAKRNASGPDLKMKREQSGQSNQSIASGSASANTKDSPISTTAGISNGSTSKLVLGGGSPASYGYNLGVGSVSLASLDKPLPAPKPDPQPIRQPPPTLRIRDPATLGEKPLPTPGPSRATSDDFSNDDTFSPYPNIPTADQKSSNATKPANTNTDLSPFVSQQAGPSGYPKDLITQLQLTQPQFPSQPLSNSSELSSPYPSPSSYMDGKFIPSTSNSNHPSNFPPSQTKPPSLKKSGLPSLKGRLSFSRRSTSPSKPPSPSKLLKVSSRTSQDRASFDVGNGSGSTPGTAAAILMTTNSYGQSGDNGPNPERIRLDDPNLDESRMRESLEQSRREPTVILGQASPAATSHVHRRTISQPSNGGLTKPFNSPTRTRPAHKPKASLGDTWLQRNPNRSPTTASNGPAPGLNEQSTTAGSSATTQSTATSYVSTNSQPSSERTSVNGTGQRRLSTLGAEIPPPSHSQYQHSTQAQQEPVPIRSSSPALQSTGHTEVSDPSRQSAVPTIPDEFHDYSTMIQNIGLTNTQPQPPPVPSLPTEFTPDVRKVPISNPAPAGHVAHARSTSLQMRKGPLIFATADAENLEPLPEPQRRSVAGQDNENPQVSSGKLPSSSPMGLMHLDSAREQHPTASSIDSERRDPVVPPNIRDSGPPQPRGRTTPSMKSDDRIFTTGHDSRIPQHPNGNGNYRGRPGSSMRFEQQVYPSISMDNRVPQPQQREYQKRSSSLVNPALQIPQQSFGDLQSTYRPPFGAQPQFTQSPQTQLRPFSPDTQLQPKGSNTPVKNREQHQPASTQSPIVNGQNRALTKTHPKPHRVLTKSRSPPASKPSSPPEPPRRLSRRIQLDADGDNRQPTLPDVWQSLSMAEGIEAPVPAPGPPVPAPAPSLRYNNNVQRPNVGDVDPLAMKRRTKVPAEHNVPAPSTAKPTATAMPSADSLSWEKTMNSIPEPIPVPDADIITEQVASPGPYDAAAPRPRSRPMTGMFMAASTLAGFLTEASLLYSLLEYLTFYDWVMLFSVSKHLRKQLENERDLREEVLERFLETVGYERWIWNEQEPLSLSLVDLNNYMKGVSMPNHQYAHLAEQWLLIRPPAPIDKNLQHIMKSCAVSTRAYSRVVLRLRAQAEAAEAEYIAKHIPVASSSNGPVTSYKANGVGSPSRGYSSRSSSRAPSPAMSMFSRSHDGYSTVTNQLAGSTTSVEPQSRGTSFRSPLFKLRRAPLLRVFVPSPDGDWLSDNSVLECESQLRRAGVMKLLRPGDIVWDVAVGDEGNVGRLVWDGNFLIDLDYSYSPSGDLPQYIHALAFSPSYFHRVIRTSPANSPQASNPIVHVDISPWGEEIASNLQLLQDRMRTSTPQGNYHTVVRWVHRSSFVIRPPPTPIAGRYGPNRARIPAPRIAIPNTKLFVDPGWYGTVVMEAEGTNEGLADLQERCGSGVFPPRAKNVIPNPGNLKPRDGKKVFRLLREKSRPGEIWMRTVSEKERLM